MTKGKPSFGKRHHSVHMNCRRCGSHSYHIKDDICASCGFGRTSKIDDYAWKNKGTISKARKV